MTNPVLPASVRRVQQWMIVSPRRRMLSLAAVFTLVWLPLLLVRLVWPGLSTAWQWVAEAGMPIAILTLGVGSLIKFFEPDARANLACVVCTTLVAVTAVGRFVAGSDFVGVMGAVEVAVSLAAASLLAPPPLRRLAVPGLVWLVAGSTAAVALSDSALEGSLGVALAVMATVPGPLLAAMRRIRRADRGVAKFFRERFDEVNEELTAARQIHESVFPTQRDVGSVRFQYRYEPMSVIGGDYLHAHISPTSDGHDEVVSVAVLDVTGHGIPAALTVNRLHGELTRLYAENPDIGPGEVLAKLNSYVYLTLADHTVFVTGLIVRVDPSRSTLEYASGGHPPAFLRRNRGSILELGATSLVIGLLDADEFDPAPVEMAFGPGDSLIAYTDGANECKDQSGEMLGIHGLRRVIEMGWAESDGRWPATLAREVERFRHGPADDDTLIVEIHRAFGAARAGVRGTEPAEALDTDSPEPAPSPPAGG